MVSSNAAYGHLENGHRAVQQRDCSRPPVLFGWPSPRIIICLAAMSRQSPRSLKRGRCRSIPYSASGSMPSRRLVDAVFNGRRFPGRRFSQSGRIKLLRPHHSMASNAPATHDRSSDRISCAPGLARVHEDEPVADDGRTGRVAWMSPAERLVWSGQGRVGHHSRLPSRLRLSMIPRRTSLLAGSPSN